MRSDSQNNRMEDLISSDFGSNSDTDSNSYDLLKKCIESYNNCDWQTYNNLFYGNFDYNKAINLYYNCLVDIYGEDSVDRINDNIKEEYNTNDYKIAFEMYRSYNADISIEEFTDKSNLSSEEIREVIELYNDSLPNSSYASIVDFEQMGNEYGDYMYETINSMYINISDVDEIVRYRRVIENDPRHYYDDIYCMKIDGEWYPLTEPMIVPYEHFASAMGG